MCLINRSRRRIDIRNPLIFYTFFLCSLLLLFVITCTIGVEQQENDVYVYEYWPTGYQKPMNLELEHIEESLPETSLSTPNTKHVSHYQPHNKRRPPPRPLRSKLLQPIRKKEVQHVLSETIQEIARDFFSPLAVICGILFTATILAFEFYAFKKAQDEKAAAERLKRRKPKKVAEELHIRFSSEEEEEESAEKEKYLPIATGVIGIVAQSLNAAAGRTFVAIEAMRLAQLLPTVIGRVLRGGDGGVPLSASTNSSSSILDTNSTTTIAKTPLLNSTSYEAISNLDFSHLNQAERVQLAQELQALERNVTAIVNGPLNPIRNNSTSIASPVGLIPNTLRKPYFPSLGILNSLLFNTKKN